MPTTRRTCGLRREHASAGIAPHAFSRLIERQAIRARGLTARRTLVTPRLDRGQRGPDQQAGHQTNNEPLVSHCPLPPSCVWIVAIGGTCYPTGAGEAPTRRSVPPRTPRTRPGGHPSRLRHRPRYPSRPPRSASIHGAQSEVATARTTALSILRFMIISFYYV